MQKISQEQRDLINSKEGSPLRKIGDDDINDKNLNRFLNESFSPRITFQAKEKFVSRNNIGSEEIYKSKELKLAKIRRERTY